MEFFGAREIHFDLTSLHFEDVTMEQWYNQNGNLVSKWNEWAPKHSKSSNDIFLHWDSFFCFWYPSIRCDPPWQLYLSCAPAIMLRWGMRPSWMRKQLLSFRKISLTQWKLARWKLKICLRTIFKLLISNDLLHHSSPDEVVIKYQNENCKSNFHQNDAKKYVILQITIKSRIFQF